MIAHCWRKSAGTLTAWCGTKNDRIMNRPITAVSMSGTSLFNAPLLLRGHPRRQAVDAQRLEDAAHDDDQDDGQLDQVRALQAADQLGLAREVGDRGVELLAHQRV